MNQANISIQIKKSVYGNESPQHYKAKERLVQILQGSNYEDIQVESKQVKVMLQFLGERTYIGDIQCQKEGRIYIFEIDGTRGHSSRWNKSKDKARDRALLDIGRWTIRLKTVWLIGRGKLSDREILEEIHYQIERQSLSIVQDNTTST